MQCISETINHTTECGAWYSPHLHASDMTRSEATNSIMWQQF